jgi:hypothetical protein
MLTSMNAVCVGYKVASMGTKRHSEKKRKKLGTPNEGFFE